MYSTPEIIHIGPDLVMLRARSTLQSLGVDISKYTREFQHLRHEKQFVMHVDTLHFVTYICISVYDVELLELSNK